jgi:nitrile hydratase subunit beta
MAGHARTPGYVQGRPGVVVAYRGIWPNPELLAYRLDDLAGVALFTVDFNLTDLWPDYAFNADRVAVDLYEHWLEPSKPEG